MKLKRQILFKQASALMMILLFIAIQVIKTSHTHEYLSKKSMADTCVSSVTHPCAICDYNFAKDNDHSFQAFSIVAPRVIVTDHIQYAAMLITSIGTTAAGRGPPSIS